MGEVELHPDEVEVLEQPITGWTVANDDTRSVALDLTVTAELRREGLARELIRLVQDLRKTARLAVEDRIDLAVTAGGEVAEALAAHREYLLSETLAVSLHAAPQGEGHEAVHELDGEEVRLWLCRVGES